jgi:nucleotidyltransferase substrate binding protein (TIGR01987 family)
MTEKDIRWQQRYGNFRKALSKLSEVVEDRDWETLSDLEKEGLIQRFEYTFELAWKTLQDLFRFKGYTDVIGPNPVLEQALRDGYLEDEAGWRSMKKSRELTSHTYDSDTADQIAKAIAGSYYYLLKALDLRLANEQDKLPGK